MDAGGRELLLREEAGQVVCVPLGFHKHQRSVRTCWGGGENESERERGVRCAKGSPVLVRISCNFSFFSYSPTAITDWSMSLVVPPTTPTVRNR